MTTGQSMALLFKTQKNTYFTSVKIHKYIRVVYLILNPRLIPLTCNKVLGPTSYMHEAEQMYLQAYNE